MDAHLEENAPEWHRDWFTEQKAATHARCPEWYRLWYQEQQKAQKEPQAKKGALAVKGQPKHSPLSGKKGKEEKGKGKSAGPGSSSSASSSGQFGGSSSSTSRRYGTESQHGVWLEDQRRALERQRGSGIPGSSNDRRDRRSSENVRTQGGSR